MSSDNIIGENNSTSSDILENPVDNVVQNNDSDKVNSVRLDVPAEIISDPTKLDNIVEVDNVSSREVIVEGLSNEKDTSHQDIISSELEVANLIRNDTRTIQNEASLSEKDHSVLQQDIVGDEVDPNFRKNTPDVERDDGSTIIPTKNPTNKRKGTTVSNTVISDNPGEGKQSSLPKRLKRGNKIRNSENGAVRKVSRRIVGGDKNVDSDSLSSSNSIDGSIENPSESAFEPSDSEEAETVTPENTSSHEERKKTNRGSLPNRVKRKITRQIIDTPTQNEEEVDSADGRIIIANSSEEEGETIPSNRKDGLFYFACEYCENNKKFELSQLDKHIRAVHGYKQNSKKNKKLNALSQARYRYKLKFIKEDSKRNFFLPPTNLGVNLLVDILRPYKEYLNTPAIEELRQLNGKLLDVLTLGALGKKTTKKFLELGEGGGQPNLFMQSINSSSKRKLLTNKLLGWASNLCRYMEDTANREIVKKMREQLQENRDWLLKIKSWNSFVKKQAEIRELFIEKQLSLFEQQYDAMVAIKDNWRSQFPGVKLQRLKKG